MSEGKKILVVDDDEDIHLSCRMVLERAGYEVLSALSAEDGRRMVGTERPDVVLLDIMMEAADSGLRMASWLAKEHPGTPVMVLSSIAAAADQVFDTSTLPIADLANKPIAPDVLLTKVAGLLARATKRGK
jgi:DNA-binding response OmpR family regulator